MYVFVYVAHLTISKSKTWAMDVRTIVNLQAWLLWSYNFLAFCRSVFNRYANDFEFTFRWFPFLCVLNSRRIPSVLSLCRLSPIIYRPVNENIRNGKIDTSRRAVMWTWHYNLGNCKLVLQNTQVIVTIRVFFWIIFIILLIYISL